LALLLGAPQGPLFLFQVLIERFKSLIKLRDCDFERIDRLFTAAA
jgi:hypothetical protein